jgi:hypothetical protein
LGAEDVDVLEGGGLESMCPSRSLERCLCCRCWDSVVDIVPHDLTQSEDIEVAEGVKYDHCA